MREIQRQQEMNTETTRDEYRNNKRYILRQQEKNTERQQERNTKTTRYIYRNSKRGIQR